MNINDAFPSNYLKASDLADAQPVVTIDRVEFEAVGRTKEMKPVVYFTGKQKGMVLNKTNSKKIAELAGSNDTDDWTGSQIKLYATEVDFQGETVEAIRVKSAVTKPVARQVTRPAARPKPEPEPAPEPEPEYAGNIDDSDIPF